MVQRTELPVTRPTTRRASNPNHLARTQVEFMGTCGRFSQSLGLSRSWGTIFGLLYLSPVEIGLQEIADLAEISKGSASQGTRQLLAMGLIRKKWMREEKRDFFEAVPNPEEALKNLYQNILKSRLENSQDKMQEFTQTLETEKSELTPKEVNHIRIQLKKLDQLRKKIKNLMQAAEVLL
jgi:DNA-binding transcriptional regulator GbsR (MarR family)